MLNLVLDGVLLSLVFILSYNAVKILYLICFVYNQVRLKDLNDSNGE